MAQTFQFPGTRFGHAAHALAGIEPGDSALADAVIQAIGVDIFSMRSCRRHQAKALADDFVDGALG